MGAGKEEGEGGLTPTEDDDAASVYFSRRQAYCPLSTEGMNSRDEEVRFLKKLWDSQPVACPQCGAAQLVLLHKKAKKSDCEWRCPACGEIYRTIRMLKELPNK